MKKRVLIVADSLEIGGIERSLISMLNNFNYDKYDIDLMLYQKTGELLDHLDSRVNLINQQDGCKTFGVPIKDLLIKGKLKMAIGRVLAKVISVIISKVKCIDEMGYYQVQLMYRYTHPFLNKHDKKYDIAIGYVWPHNYIIDKVDANAKIGWIHTDYSTIKIDRKIDEKMWSKLDKIISISEDCSKAFIKYYPELEDKLCLVENITASEFIKNSSNKEVTNVFSEENFNILSIGRICYQKGFDFAVEALSELHNRGYRNIKWYIIGFGPDKEKIEELIKKYKLEDSFVLLGKKSNPYPFLKDCDLYVQPSRYEGKAVTIAEAKILEKPIIITNYETARSQINHKYDGYITELSVEGITNSIIELYSNEKLRNKLEINCLNMIHENVKELDKLYEIM